jgi:hypothetical protein
VSVTGFQAETNWLPLLRTMTTTSDRWCVWKNVDRALAGHGDVDSAAPYAEWRDVSNAYEGWARSLGVTIFVTCQHTPGMKSFSAVLPGISTLFQFDVFSETFWRGSPLFAAEQLVPLTTLDHRGFRRLVPGAEGVLLFIFNGVGRTGRPIQTALRQKHVFDLLRDWEGVVSTTRILRTPDELLDALDAFRTGAWDARSLRKIQMRAVSRSLRDGRAARRVAFQWKARMRPCPIARALRDGRSVPADLDAWRRTIQEANDPRDKFFALP